MLAGAVGVMLVVYLTHPWHALTSAVLVVHPAQPPACDRPQDQTAWQPSGAAAGTVTVQAPQALALDQETQPPWEGPRCGRRYSALLTL
jgi:predicted cobalt transporter CbtA